MVALREGPKQYLQPHRITLVRLRGHSEIIDSDKSLHNPMNLFFRSLFGNVPIKKSGYEPTSVDAVKVSMTDQILEITMQQGNKPDGPGKFTPQINLTLGLPLNKPLNPSTVQIRDTFGLHPVSDIRHLDQFASAAIFLFNAASSYGNQKYAVLNGSNSIKPGFVRVETGQSGNERKTVNLENTTTSQRVELVRSINRLQNELSKINPDTWLTHYLDSLLDSIKGDTPNEKTFIMDSANSRTKLPRYTRSIYQIAGHRIYGNKYRVGKLVTESDESVISPLRYFSGVRETYEAFRQNIKANLLYKAISIDVLQRLFATYYLRLQRSTSDGIFFPVDSFRSARNFYERLFNPEKLKEAYKDLSYSGEFTLKPATKHKFTDLEAFMTDKDFSIKINPTNRNVAVRYKPIFGVKIYQEDSAGNESYKTVYRVNGRIGIYNGREGIIIIHENGRREFQALGTAESTSEIIRRELSVARRKKQTSENIVRRGFFS